ncbi:MAG: hypothetical protein IPP66_11890 [Anaerolineales bacterium]|nr:hypothetical protein [Anaerolineales bacterium]
MIKKLKALPHILLLRRSSSKAVLEKDMLKWFQVYKPKLQKNTAVDLLCWLLDTHPEFRNLFYIRIGRYSGVAGKALLFLAKKLYKPLKETLRFAEPANIGAGFFRAQGLGPS